MLWYLNTMLELACTWLAFRKKSLWTFRLFSLFLVFIDVTSFFIPHITKEYSYFYWGSQSGVYLLLMALALELCWRTVHGYCAIGVVRTFSTMWSGGLCCVLIAVISDTWINSPQRQTQLGLISGILIGTVLILTVTLPRRCPWPYRSFWITTFIWVNVILVCCLGWLPFEKWYPSLTLGCMFLYLASLVGWERHLKTIKLGLISFCTQSQTSLSLRVTHDSKV